MRWLVLLTLTSFAAACSSSEESGGPNPSTDAATDGSIDASLDGGSDASADAPDAQTPDGTPDVGSDGDPGAWQLPSCTTVGGTGAVTFTHDDGATLAPTSETLTGTVYTKGLVALETANTLLAASGSALLRSTDAGCTWAEVATLPSSLMILERGRGDRAFGWEDNGQPLVRIDGTSVTVLKNPVQNTIGLGADPSDPNRVRLGGGDGSLWESIDAGQSWSPIGTLPSSGSALLAYRFEFDPNDLDHVLFGAASIGAFVSFDGGGSWQGSGGLGFANAFELAVSPADSMVVWAEGIDLAENLDGGGQSEGRHIFRSTDGGKSFVPVVDHVPGVVTLTNGLPLVPHPQDPNVVFFEFGSYFQDYGTDLFKYDAESQKLDKTHNPYDDVLALAFSPADASLIYLAVSSVQIQ